MTLGLGIDVPTADAPTAEVLTPRARTVVRRWLFWVGAGLVALVIGLIAFATAGSVAQLGYLDPANPAPQGAKALAEVLRQQGVTVVETTSLDDTRTALDDVGADSATVFVYDTELLLSDSQWRAVAALSSRVIIADPGFSALDVAAPGVAQAGVVDGTLSADCTLATPRRAGKISGTGSGLRIVGNESRATGCFGSDGGVYSLVELRDGDNTLTLLGATDALTNGRIIENGNAALALGLLGERSTLVWYSPSILDVESTQPKTLGELTPLWVTPAIGMLAVAAFVAALWRGRRLGPLVIENLPVTVRASETMEGRARLYERSSARLRALDALRVGSIDRLAGLCGLSRLASIDDVVGAVASTTGRQVGDVRLLLIDGIPSSDRDLIELSDSLLRLEQDVARALRP